jgi:hypothetical protein
MVTMYFECRLTYRTDVFPALSGLARAFHRQMIDDQYLAGLWRNDIIRGLFWFVWPGPGRGRERERETSAPSEYYGRSCMRVH